MLHKHICDKDAAPKEPPSSDQTYTSYTLFSAIGFSPSFDNYGSISDFRLVKRSHGLMLSTIKSRGRKEKIYSIQTEEAACTVFDNVQAKESLDPSRCFDFALGSGTIARGKPILSPQLIAKRHQQRL